MDFKQAGEQIPEGLSKSYKVAKFYVAAESHNKCMYCESKILHVSFGDVEHIIAKDAIPESRYDYNNLGLVCSVCNRNKPDYHGPIRPLINPYVDAPEDHFLAAGPMVKHRPGYERACITEIRLQLNRSRLIEQRTERINRLHHLVHVYETSVGAMKETIKTELLREAESDKEYSFVVRAYITLAAGL